MNPTPKAGRPKGRGAALTQKRKCGKKARPKAEFDHDRIRQGGGEFYHVPISEIMPSPENDSLYRPIDPNDPEIRALAESIKRDRLLEPLVITLDGFLVSGHRRLTALKVAGVKSARCKILPIRREDDPDAFVKLLREYNRQREKNNAERLREELIDVNPEEAARSLHIYRREQAAVNVEEVKIVGTKHRAMISAAKAPMLEAIKRTLEELRSYWPLSDRRIHYWLAQHYKPLIHASKRKQYTLDNQSYRALTELLTRARLTRDIPFAAIGDETRPVILWDAHLNSRSFIRKELVGMFKGYWRDLMQSQPNHIEIVGEKNTILPIIRSVAGEYTIPLTIGRGFCSLSPRHAIAQRFEKSGKENLVLLIVSDNDPDGEEICHSFARSMRDDFDIADVCAVKAGLTREQVVRFGLLSGGKAKPGKKKEARAIYTKFVRTYGSDEVYELEAMQPETLQAELRSAIEAVINRDAYSSEIEAENVDATYLEGVRRTVVAALKGIDLEGADDE